MAGRACFQSGVVSARIILEGFNQGAEPIRRPAKRTVVWLVVLTVYALYVYLTWGLSWDFVFWFTFGVLAVTIAPNSPFLKCMRTRPDEK